MTEEVALQSINYIAENCPPNTGIIFFGGEPLLRKDLIKKTIEYAQQQKDYYHYKITTNGTLLDENFLYYATKVGLQISISIDGNETAHNTYRRTKADEPTFHIVIEKAKLLLKHQPYAKCLMTITPETLSYYCESVDFLIKCGFKYIIVSIDYTGN